MVVSVCLSRCYLFPALPATSFIMCNYGGVVTSQNGGEKALHITTGVSRIRELVRRSEIKIGDINSFR